MLFEGVLDAFERENRGEAAEDGGIEDEKSSFTYCIILMFFGLICFGYLFLMFRYSLQDEPDENIVVRDVPKEQCRK